MNKKEFDQGYKDAINEIKKSLEQSGDLSNMKNPGDGNSDGLDPIPTSSKNDNSHKDRTNGDSIEIEWDKDSIKENEKKGTSGRAGDFIDEKKGNDIAQSEGYKPSNENPANKWKRLVEKNFSKLKQALAGKVGGDSFTDKLGRVYRSNTDWEEKLDKIVGSCISKDTGDIRMGWANKNILVSQNRPVKKQFDDAFKHDAIGYMVIVLDTSGSMTTELLRKMMIEAYSVALSKKPMNIVTIQIDTRITDINICSDMGDFEDYCNTIKLKGGGGTDFEDAWAFLAGKKTNAFREEYEEIQTMGDIAELVLVFTDGYVNFTNLKRDPEIMENVIWGIIDNPSFELPKQIQDENTGMIHLPSGRDEDE